MEVHHSELYAKCAKIVKQSAELITDRRNRESEGIGEVEDVKYVQQVIMEVHHSELYAKCAKIVKQSAELITDRRNRESEDKGEVEDVKYVNTQDYLDIGETIVGQRNRAAPEVDTTLGFIKEEHIDPDDAEILAHKEIIRHLINKKVDVSQEIYTCIKTEEQADAGPSIMSEAEDVPLDRITDGVIKKESSTSSELDMLVKQVASWRVVLYRLPTDTLLPSTSTSGGPVPTANNDNYKAINEFARIEARHDVIETEEIDKNDTKNVISKKFTFNDIHHNLANKQIETNTYANDTVFSIPDQELYKHIKYICDHCQTKFSSKMKLQRHMPIHSSTSPTYHYCPNCTYKCVSIQLLKKHSRLHYENRRLACYLCTYRFSSNRHLKKHLRTHMGQKLYKCDTCDYASSQLRNLKTHMSTHTGEKTFKCDSCDYASIDLGNLNRHMRRHTGEKPFKCTSCDYTSIRLDYLKIHMKRHTGEKPLKCDTCDYACSHSHHLKTHMRIHTGEKPFQCNTCDYVSSRLDYLKSHMKKHTGEKPFKCDTCDYATSQLGALNKHMRRHTGVKAFKCVMCDYASYESAKLKRHMRRHRNPSAALKAV